MRDVDTALVQRVLDVPQRKRVANIHHHREADDLGRLFETVEKAGIAHAARASLSPPSTVSCSMSDAAILDTPKSEQKRQRRSAALIWCRLATC